MKKKYKLTETEVIICIENSDKTSRINRWRGKDIDSIREAASEFYGPNVKISFGEVKQLRL